MKRIFILLLSVLFLSISYNSEAQVVGKYLEKKMKQATRRAGKKTDEKITKEMNKKVDKAVDNAFEGIISDEEKNEYPSRNYSSDSTSTSTASMMKSLGLSSPENVEESYDYTGNILMSVQTWDDKGKTEGEINYVTYMSDEYKGFAMEFYKENHRSLMIFDTRNGNMIILTESGGSKTGLVTAYNTDSLWNDEYSMSETVEEQSIYNKNLQKTGRTKTIAGYSCDEYRYEDEEIEGNVWMTDELPTELWTRMFSANVIAASNIGNYGGFVMELNQKNKENGEQNQVLVKEVNQDQPRTISTRDYQLISYGGSLYNQQEQGAE